MSIERAVMTGRKSATDSFHVLEPISASLGAFLCFLACCNDSKMKITLGKSSNPATHTLCF